MAVERYIKTVEEHLRKVIAFHQRYWDSRLHILLMAYRASTHNMSLTPASLVFQRELPTALRPAVWDTPDGEQPISDHAANLVDHLYGIHNYARQYMKLVSYRMKTHYDRLTNCAGYEGGKVWLCHPNRMKGTSAKLRSSWEGP
jgi:hypothetical protein